MSYVLRSVTETRAVRMALERTGGKVDPSVRASILREGGEPYTDHVSFDCQVRHIPAAEVKSLVAAGKMRAVSDPERVFRFVASTESVDRMGDIVRQNWKLTNFKANPVILWGHRPDMSDAIMGRSVMETVVTGSGGARLELAVEFARQEHNPQAEMKFLMYRDGFLKAGSVGFNPLKVTDVRDPEERRRLGLGPWGCVFEEAELLEFSLVAIPANPDAVIQSMREAKTYSEESIALAQQILSEVEEPKAAPEPVTKAAKPPPPPPKDEAKPEGKPEDKPKPPKAEDKPDDSGTEGNAGDFEPAIKEIVAAKDAISRADALLAKLQVEPEDGDGPEDVPAGDDPNMMPPVPEDDPETETGAIRQARGHLGDANAALDKAMGILENSGAEEDDPSAKGAEAEQRRLKSLSRAFRSLSQDDKTKAHDLLALAKNKIADCLEAIGQSDSSNEAEEPDDEEQDGEDGGKSGGDNTDPGSADDSPDPKKGSNGEDVVKRGLYDALLSISKNLEGLPDGEQKAQ